MNSILSLLLISLVTAFAHDAGYLNYNLQNVANIAVEGPNNHCRKTLNKRKDSIKLIPYVTDLSMINIGSKGSLNAVLTATRVLVTTGSKGIRLTATSTLYCMRNTFYTPRSHRRGRSSVPRCGH